MSIARLVVEVWEGGVSTRQQRGMAARAVLDYLAGYPGLTWQERWDASPVGQGLEHVNDLECRRSPSIKLSTGLRALICLRVIEPSLVVFRRHHMSSFATMFIAAQGDPLLDDFVKQVEVHQHSYAHRTEALYDLCVLLASQGVALSDVTAPALLHFAQENRRAWALVNPGNKAGNRLRGQGVWHVLHAAGHLPPTVPPTMRAALMRGQKSVEELVDHYPIRNRAVRGLLIEYFTRRRADTDYGTLKNLVLHLAHHFWEKIERISPDQADLRISPETYDAWRKMIAVKDNGAPRAGADGLVISIRSFYYAALPGASGTPTPDSARRRVPGHHLRRMDRVRGALRSSQGRARFLRPPVRHPLPARARLRPVPDAARQPQDAAPPRGTGRRPPRPPSTLRSRGLDR
ncbi:hypothetical protein [Streptomyces sp. V3I7]|uniref:hypothetical protein n=1 Tax=Streptomyces sp. V3I7 TaxID=3042278 RepID=UPI0027D8FA72|nr:hypothetical protein [Streptomyces sp. V3I7]